jgi:WXXGXW repeat (2 copies)
MMPMKFRRLGPAGLAIAAALAVTPAVFAPAPAEARIAIGISVDLAPPALPVYVQPPLPAEGYIWVPGYWAYGDDGYYWVAGAWEQPPDPGLLWTPAYWGWDDGAYVFHDGYWAPHVGFYGGIDYGYGYGGIGYAGGYWEGGHLFYNRAVNNFGSVHVTNVYNRTVVNHVHTTRVSYNGGNGGTRARPSAAELAAQREHHVAPTGQQVHRVEAARGNPAMRSTVIAPHGNRAPRAEQTAAHAPDRFGAGRQPMSHATPHPVRQADHPAQSPSTAHRPAMAAGRYTAPARPMHTTPAVAPHPMMPHPAAPMQHAAAPHRAMPARPAEAHVAPAPHPMPQPVSHRSAAPPARPNYVQPAHFPQPQRAAPPVNHPAPHPAAAHPAPAHPAPQHDNNARRPGH